jgi:small subunit ribosomal protein S3
MEGRVPLHTLRADIDYSITEARTMMGCIGVKVWIYKGDILPPPPEERAEELETIEVTIPSDEPAEEEEATEEAVDVAT